MADFLDPEGFEQAVTFGASGVLVAATPAGVAQAVSLGTPRVVNSSALFSQGASTSAAIAAADRKSKLAVDAASKSSSAVVS